jgi:SRSO17 transposase
MRDFVRDFRACFKRESTFELFQLYLLGLQSDVARHNIELIARVAGVAVRTLQEFLQFFKWDHRRVNAKLQRRVVDHHGTDQAIGVLDPSAHAKRGTKTPGVQRQWCGETGKVDNCVIGQQRAVWIISSVAARDSHDRPGNASRSRTRRAARCRGRSKPRACIWCPMNTAKPCPPIASIG